MKQLKLFIAVLFSVILAFPLYANPDMDKTSTEEKQQEEVKSAPDKPNMPMMNPKMKKTMKPNLIHLGGGIELLSETVMGDRYITDFYQRASLFVFGNVKPKKLGYFIHLMSVKDPNVKGDTDTSFTTAVAFVWANPVKFVNIRFGELKKPAETTYLPLWSGWMFERPPMIFGVLGKEKMVGVDSSVQVTASYKKLVSLQFNAFRTDASIISGSGEKEYFNLLYFAGLKVTPSFGKAKLGIFANYGFEPHAGLISTANNVNTLSKRNSLTAGAWFKGYNAEFYGQYVDYKREKNTNGTTADAESKDILAQVAYNVPLKGFTLHPKVRYDSLDPNAAGTGDGKTAIVLGVDAILAHNPKIKLDYKIGLEYQLNQEESNEVDNNILRLVFEVAHF